MRDNVFLDTNILVYSSLQDDKSKHVKTLQFLDTIKGKAIFISTQVLNEVYISLLKHKLKNKDIEDIADEIIRTYNISIITVSTIKTAWKLRKQYTFSYWDSLIAASALENECETLFTEDLQYGLVINGILTIRNPFK